MKGLMIKIAIFITIALTISCNAQPNSTSNYEVGIINPEQNKTYIFFKEVKTDSLTSQLVANMDYLNPNVTGLITPLTNFRTIGDTLFGDFSLADVDYQRFIKAGLVKRNNTTNKYSGMTVTFWAVMDMLEPRPGFFIRKK